MFIVSDLTHLARERAKADAEFYKVQKEAESNKVRTSLLVIYSSKQFI